jgi:hypothetical protein
MALFVVCGIHTKLIPGGLNIQGSMQVFETISSEEAVGKYVMSASKMFPDHELFQTPLFMSIEKYSDSKADGIAQGRREAAEALCRVRCHEKTVDDCLRCGCSWRDAILGTASAEKTNMQDRERLEWLIYHCLQNDASPISISRGRELLGFADMIQMREWMKVYRDSGLYGASAEKTDKGEM